MLGYISAYWTSQLVLVAARLGIADELARRPLTPEALAEKTGTHAPSLRRVLRALASLGVFAVGADGRYRTTPLGRTLQGDAPGSLRKFALMMVDDYNWQSWGALEHGVRTGEIPFDHVHGRPIFEYLRERPEKDRIFSESMASISGVENAAIARAFPFGRLRTLVDVGGAHGHLLATILGRHRRLRGVLYDQPQVVAGAASAGFVTASGVAERCTMEGGSFFERVPAGADAYLLKYIIHDWNDAQCEGILSRCREAMAPDGRVLVVEHVITPGNGPEFGKLLDVNMLVGPGGLERTRAEFAALFRRAGLRLRAVHETASPLSILEATAETRGRR